MKKWVIFVSVVLLVGVGTVHAIDMNGLAMYLPLDEGTGKTAKDMSGNNNDGELRGDVSWTDGVSGGGVFISDSSANNMIAVKDSDSLDITGDMTICMWVNLKALTGSCAIITKADTYMIHASDWSGKGIEMELLLWPFDSWQTAASTPIQFNEWKHVTGVYDGSAIKMYIDGELKGQRARSGATAVTSNELVIGRDNRGCCNTRVFALTVDDVMVWSRALSDAEIKEAMVGVTPVNPTGLLATVWGEMK